MLLHRVVAALCAASVAGAQTTLIATVSSGGSRPVANVEVVVIDVARTARTDSLGVARVANVASGLHRVRVRKPGYAAVDVELPFQGDSISSSFFLTPIGTTFDTVHVVARSVPSNLREFDARRQLGIGRFLTEEDLKHDMDRDFGYVAVERFPGLHLQPDAEGRMVIMNTRGPCGGPTGSPQSTSLRPGGRGASGGPGGSFGASSGAGSGGGGGATMRGSCGSGAPCPVLIFLDGVPLGQDGDAIDLIHTWDLSGVEYYTAAMVPVQYQKPGSGCGALLFWSRIF